MGACNPNVPPPLVTAGLQRVLSTTKSHPLPNLIPPPAFSVYHGDPEDVDDEEAGKDVGEALRGG